MKNSFWTPAGVLFALLVLAGCAQHRPDNPNSTQAVIILHGLGRTASAMNTLEDSLRTHGYHTLNIDYPSRHMPLPMIAQTWLDSVLKTQKIEQFTQVHFITHSMGGILTRAYLQAHPMSQLGRIVMLAPPNQGSHLAEVLSWNPIFNWMMGPNLKFLSDQNKAYWDSLSTPPTEIAVITGSNSINWINSWIIDGVDDGKVSPAESHLRGEKAWQLIPTNHAVIMKNDSALQLSLRFLKFGDLN